MAAEIMMMMVKEEVKEGKDNFYKSYYTGCRVKPAAFFVDLTPTPLQRERGLESSATSAS